ncbi:hypothetical protein IIV31_163R [Armadillidium vulgare iridescent virus]|uniref:XPG-I domain-containing protein n=1 Tax=Armadillidium vulgare iridescent virus TaxID=72201 RepID=A0A068QL57_9VIRU|nr:hypothetical protein IIV31_163R [Armadillidium vulgare iridescent virus]CCV02535.1 hypothetical protein IIV31_163R [Armadillidium vulgare iridescent virus]
MEAEALCAFLEKEGTVAAVVSNDSDVLAYGCKKLIVDFNFKNEKNEDMVTLIDNEILKASMGFDQHKFLDFCIMCGTDYNKNIFRVGPVSALKLITVNERIENIQNLDTSILNFKRVRDLFFSFGMKDKEGQNNEHELFKFNNMCSWSGKPDFGLLFLFLSKVNIDIDFEWMKDGFDFNEELLSVLGERNKEDKEEECPVF